MKYIFILLAGVIILLHSITPHIHEGDSIFDTEQNIAESEGMMDWLKDLFKYDLGEGHLECFNLSDNSSLQLDHLSDWNLGLDILPSKAIESVPGDLLNYRSCITQTREGPLIHFPFPQDRLRGPPHYFV
ncbi:MAG: hypothetical protein KJP00_06025 [Bacteroidia bacterium]|nr:hypothetical protein [Bacteroidia bacterium]